MGYNIIALLCCTLLGWGPLRALKAISLKAFFGAAPFKRSPSLMAAPPDQSNSEVVCEKLLIHKTMHSVGRP